jgi:NADH:ubiquinone oxidoreductase subunit E
MDLEKPMEPSSIYTILEDRGAEPFDIMEVLQDVQASYGYLPEEVLRQASASFDLPLIEVFRLANFYKAFSLTPRGRHLVTVCTGTACHVRGAPKMLTEATTQLAIQPGETTEDRAFSLETVNCLGACALGPVVVLDGRYHDHMDAAKFRALLASVRKADAEAAGDDLAGEDVAGRSGTIQIEVGANA